MCMWVGGWFASHNISDYMLQDLVYARVCVWVCVLVVRITTYLRGCIVRCTAPLLFRELCHTTNYYWVTFHVILDKWMFETLYDANVYTFIPVSVTLFHFQGGWRVKISWVLADCIFFCYVYAGITATPSVRLVGGSSGYEGRLQVFYDGVWSTVCDIYWSQLNTDVACQSAFGAG